ncbi:hypothetical protein EL22_26230 [Halostagnicola sp. A56]|uniref:DUF7346 family protein n=1 Tax=Halostagnicola sp. A56 TaxID=1495067 RepID=UPI00065F6A92|nr:hypothetical protein [Halostagnicola sp. A56]KMT45901.1 hypothetical protein EL22_26230 [Halostagnicola sp. A56]
MKTVRADDGTDYVLLKRSDDASLVRDPATGNECYVRNDRLEIVDRSPLETAASAVPESVRRLVTNVHDEKALGLLFELAERGPTGVRTLLDATDFCESDLHGTLTVLTASDLLEETTVADERGYRVTESGREALEWISAENDPSL